MRVLHVVKTSDGAEWAAGQVQQLTLAGVEVHVAVPNCTGRTMDAWLSSGAVIHQAGLSFPVADPSRWTATVKLARHLVEKVNPDIIHSHFLNTTLTLRVALHKTSKIPRIFQVPGPLHLEHWHSRNVDLNSAGPTDYWVGSSQCIVDQFRKAGVNPNRLFLSYYGGSSDKATATGISEGSLE